MSVEGDPNQQSPWTVPNTPSGQAIMPADAEPTTGADRWALIALAVSLAVLLSSCVPGFSCLAPLVVGIIALTQAKNAANPNRARTYGWIATGIGIAILVLVLVVVALYGAAIMATFDDINRELR